MKTPSWLENGRVSWLKPETSYELVNISKKFQEKHSISTMKFARIYDDGSGYAFYTVPGLGQQHISWAERVQTPLVVNVPESLISDRFYYILPKDGICEAMRRALKDVVSFDAGISIVERHSGYIENLGMGFSLDTQAAVHQFLNKKEIFDGFLGELKEKAGNLIQSAEQDKVKIPVSLLPNFGGLQIDQSIGDMKLNRICSYLKNISYEIAAIPSRSSPFGLSKRELECIKYLLSGYSAKAIGKELSLSHRTIESYLLNIRNKMNCKDKNEIIFKLFQNL